MLSKIKIYHKYLLLTLQVFLFLGLITTTEAATGDITAVRILGNTCTAGASCNGYVAEIDIEGFSTGGAYDFGFSEATAGSVINSLAKVKFNVTSPGYDTNGNLTTIARTVYGTRWLRKPYPDQATADETLGAGIVTVRVVLSEFIYVNDTVTATVGAGFYTQASTPNNAVTGLSVTNNSTYVYPKPVGRWSWVPYERVASDFLLESTIFHRFAQNGKPLAAVKYTCIDEHSNSVTRTVNDMTVSTREDSANTGNAVLVYAATIPVASFTQGDVITCNFTAYPWVGNSTSLLNSDLVANGGDGFAQPDERLGPFELLNDKNGTYGTPCAIVASTGQVSNLATWVYSSCAAAEAAYAGNNTLSYADIGRASQAIKTYNNANHGHNDPGGGTIELEAQNYTTPGTASATTLGTQKTWLIVQPASDILCQTPVINANGNNDLMAQKLKYSCVSTLTASGNTFRGDATYLDILWLDRMKLNSTEGASIRYFDTIYATRNTVDALSNGFRGSYGTIRWPPSLIRGNVYTPRNSSVGAPMDAMFQNVLGNKGFRTYARYTNADGFAISDNAVWAFNSALNDDSSSVTISIASVTHTTFPAGVAIVQNLSEHANSVQLVVGIENMGGTDSINNLIFWHNTSRGQRSNVAYADDADHCTTAVPLFTNWTWKYNIDSNNNRIGDIHSNHSCPANGGRTGNWSMAFMVGGAGNALAVGEGPSWSQPDYLGLYSVGVPSVAGFVSDLSSVSYGGIGGGNGDYHLIEASSLRSVVPTGQAVIPYDLEGNARYNDGLGAIGAYEYVIASVSSGGGRSNQLNLLTSFPSVFILQKEAIISWKTQEDTGYTLIWGKKDSNSLNSATSAENKESHSHTISDLDPDTIYTYTLDIKNNLNKGVQIKGEFKTLGEAISSAGSNANLLDDLTPETAVAGGTLQSLLLLLQRQVVLLVAQLLELTKVNLLYK